MLTSLAVSDKRIPEWLSIICRLQNWGLVCWEAACLVWSPLSCLAAAQRSWARVVRWKAKVASSLTDVWQQLFEQEDITVIWTIHFHPWLQENRTSAAAPGDTDWNRHTETCLSETSEGSQWAEAASDWNVVSNHAAELHWPSKIVLMLVSKPKANTELLKRKLLFLWTNWRMFRFAR